MHIERSHCVELGEAVNIYDARRHYFRQTPPRKRFRFLCSDEECREANKTKVTGVNYDKLAEEVKYYVKPHFRENTEHILDCEWVLLQIALDEVKKESDSGSEDETDIRRPRRGKSSKSSDVVDIFTPNSATVAGDVERLSDEMRGEIRRIPTRRGKIDALKKHLKENPSQTSFLENVVDSYLRLGLDNTRVTRLKIGRSGWRSYRECFRPVGFYDRGPNNDVIYYGGARAKSFGHNISLIFYDEVRFEGGQRNISLYIEKERLDRYRHRAYLSEMLEKLLSREADYATCYFYGRIRPSEKNDDFLDVDVDHLDNLVLKLKLKQRK